MIKLLKYNCIIAKGNYFYLIAFGFPLLLAFSFIIWCFTMPYPPNISRYYITVIAIFSTIQVAYISSDLISIDKACGSYKELLVPISGRTKTILSRILFSLIVYIISIAVSFLLFYVFFEIILGNENLNNYLFASLILITCQPVIILFHIWITLMAGKDVSVGVAILEVITSSILSTKLGDSIWIYFPSSWGSRTHYISTLDVKYTQDVILLLLIFLSVSILFIVLFVYWFKRYEPKDQSLMKNND